MHPDSKLRAQPFAQPAAGAFLRLRQLGDAVRVQHQTVLRAHLHADVAALAPGGSDFEAHPGTRGVVLRSSSIQPRPRRNASRLTATVFFGTNSATVRSQSVVENSKAIDSAPSSTTLAARSLPSFSAMSVASMA